MPAPSSSAGTARSFATVKTKVTEIGQVYVVMPVPDSVQKAGKVRIAMTERTTGGCRVPAAPASRRLAAQGGGQAAAAAGAAGRSAAAPTPRLANGKPDLTGSWQRRPSRRSAPRVCRRRHVPAVHAVPVEALHGVDQPERGLAVHVDIAARSAHQPLYKPEYWDKIIELDQWTNRDDPVMTCLPLGHSAAGTAGANLPHR